MIELTPELKREFQTFDKITLNFKFKMACLHGNLAIVQYLLTSPELNEHADIAVDEYYGFQIACEKGHLDVVKYLLTSPELTEHADIHADDDYGFRYACACGHLDIVKYLLTSPELTDHADIHASNDDCLYLAGEYEQLEMITYLLGLYNKHYLNFQNTFCNLAWAMENKYHDIVYIMIQSLYINDRSLFDVHYPDVFDYFTGESLSYSIRLLQDFNVKTEINSYIPELHL